MKLFRILHLSDIHIGDTYMDSKDIAYRIISDIEGEKLNSIRSVIVTGDIFEGSCGLRDGIVSEAVKFFDIIFEELNVFTKIEKADFLFVPGNHDIMREEDISQRWKKYKNFLNSFYGTIPDFYDSGDFSLLKTYDNSRIAFVGFNSCGLKKELMIDEKILKNIEKIDQSEFDKFKFDKKALLDFINIQTKIETFVDFGEIMPQQILKVKRKLDKYDDYNIIAFFHHHFYLFPEVYSKYGDSSLIRNYTNVIQHLQQAHVKTVLHGHKHFDLERPLITDSYYENTNNIINIIAGGSVGTKRVVRHTFNIIDFYDKDSDLELIQHKFVYNNDQLEPIIIRQIPPKSRNNNTKIRLFNILELNNPDLFYQYTDAIAKINIVANDYSNMLKWLENIFIGFEEIQKIFETDTLCIFFLLYAMNYRILKIKEILGKENIDVSYYNILNDLLLNDILDMGFDESQYLKIFEQSDYDKLKNMCDKIFDFAQNKKSKYYLSFSMISIFITDIYLMLRYYAGSFYKNIKYKVNIKLDETEFHQNVPVQKIMIHSDADRRSAFIDLRCNSATAHKLAVLFIKEFELIISKFEDYFKIVGLKLYYITPKIEKSNLPNAIDNYNFEAYIPTLISLLTGNNIYAKKEVFARELIQNSIDAIAVRASMDKDFDQTIYITLGQLQGKMFFRIKDFGTGMDRFKIERYFTSIGRSFYSGDEYRDLEINYKPISSFGIGFLSVFMICREINVKTRYYLDEKEGLKIHIPNYEGCFFIEKDDTLDIGTEITLYIDKKISHNIQPNEIINYICDTMKDISYDIIIQDDINQNKKILRSKTLRKSISNNDILFVPFLDSGEIVENVSVKEIIRTNDFIERYDYGLLVDLTRENQIGAILNSGIKLYDTKINYICKLIFDIEKKQRLGFGKFFLFNFPSNYLNIDVSREKIIDFDRKVIKPNFKIKLMSELLRQMHEYIDLCKISNTKNEAINFNLLIRNLMTLCKQNSELSQFHSDLMNIIYVLYIRFNNSTIDIFVNRLDDNLIGAIPYIKNYYIKFINEFKTFLALNLIDEKELSFLESEYEYTEHSIFEDFYEYTEYSIFEDLIDEDKNEDEGFIDRATVIIPYLQKDLKSKDDRIICAFILMATWVNETKNESIRFFGIDDLLTMFLQRYTVSEIENGKCMVSIRPEDIKKVIKELS